MTGKRFEVPRPDWNILKRLGQLADGYDVDWRRELSDAERFAPQGARNDKALVPVLPDGKNACNRPVGSDRGIVGVGE